jgi:hypothetical protein
MRRLSASSTQLRFQLSYSVETGYDHVIVEGQQDWTTLPDLKGGTSTAPPAECAAGFLLDLHPFLANYLGGADCTEPGATGTWNSFTGSSNGWTEAGVDLSAYAGQQVEVSISSVTDPFVGDVGVFVDDTRVVVNDAVVEQDGFEGATSAWTVGGPPAGSPPNGQNWQIAGQLVTVYAGTSTEDTLLPGFGPEHLATAEERADLVGRALSGAAGLGQPGGHHQARGVITRHGRLVMTPRGW